MFTLRRPSRGTLSSTARRVMRLLPLLLFVLLLIPRPTTAQGSGEVIVLTVRGPISPAMGGYLERGLKEAEARDAQLVVLRLNTPGGNVGIMGQLVEQLSNATVPTLVYVWPSGGRAASAGTLITLSADLAAMAPQTTIGAASVVGSGGEEVDETLNRKITNDLVAQIRAQTERRGPEAAAWAERAIREAVAANESEALDIGLIDYVARDLTDLLTQADGATVALANGESRTLSLRAAPVRELGMNPIEQFLHLLTNPDIALLLISLGGLALAYEFASPGGFVGGVFGIIATLLGFYALGALDANWAGLALMVVAFILFVIELKTGGHGAWAVGGIAAFIFGALLLFQNSYTPVSLWLVLLLALMAAAFFLFAIAAIMRVRHKRPITGKEGLIGEVGEVREAIVPHRRGMVFVEGELWQAVSDEEIPSGAAVQVVALDGLRLRVVEVIDV